MGFVTAPIAMISAAVISGVATIGSGIMSYMQGKAQAATSRQSAAYAQQMALRNQQIAQVAAEQARAKGAYEAEALRTKQKKMLSKQIALYGASGVDIYGSPMEVMGGVSGEYEKDILSTIRNANYQAWQYETSGETSLLEGNATASRYLQEANTYSTRAYTNLVTAPLIAGTSILTSYGDYSMAQKYGYDPKR